MPSGCFVPIFYVGFARLSTQTTFPSYKTFNSRILPRLVEALAGMFDFRAKQLRYNDVSSLLWTESAIAHGQYLGHEAQANARTLSHRSSGHEVV